jgi:chaperonin GroES
MPFLPLKNRVQIRRVKGPEKIGRIIIPEAFRKNKPNEGEAGEGHVVAVGPGMRLESGKMVEPSVKVGDRVAFKSWEGNDVIIEGEHFVVVFEEMIDGIFGEEA